MRRRILSSILALALLAPAAANADLIQISAGEANQIQFSDEHSPSIIGWFDTLTVSQFDPSLGLLNSVEITFEAIMESAITFDNDGIETAVEGLALVLTGGSFVGLGSLNVFLSDSTGIWFLRGDDSGGTDVPGDGGNDELTISGLTANEILMTTLTPADTDFVSFIGTGNLSTVGLGANGGLTLLGNNTSDVDAVADTVVGATLNITYNYTAGPITTVPEPSILTLFGFGLLGLGLVRRKTA